MTVDPGGQARPAPPPLAAYTGYLLRRAYALSRGVAAAALPPPHTLSDVVVLRILATHGSLAQQELGRRAGINRSLIGKVVAGLEERGLITRQRDPADRRATAIELTPAGRAGLATLGAALARGEAAFVGNLTPAERARLDTLLREVVHRWSEDSAGSTADTIGGLIEQAHSRLRATAVEALAPIGLHPRHFGALATLITEQPCSQQHLARHLGVSAPAVVEIVDALDAAGLLRRTRSALDRRLNDVTLTAAGLDCTSAAKAAAARIQAQVAERLGSAADRELRHLLTKLLEGTLPAGAGPKRALPVPPTASDPCLDPRLDC